MPLLAVAVAAMRAASGDCAALADRPPLTIVVQAEAQWQRGVRAHFDAARPLTIHLDPRVLDGRYGPGRVRVIVRHEVEHACRFAERPADVAYWAMGETVR